MLTVHEASRRQTHVDAVAHLFQARPFQWVSALELEQVGGRFAWRTRVSDARLHFGMTIENRQRTERTPYGTTRISEYRYVPAGQQELF
jgi:hypothetical protein